MNSRSSGGRLEAFFTGKGFYIVLFLCAAIIGGSAWMMAAGEPVCAAHAVSVESIVQDDLYGTALSVSHGDGARTVYANLAGQPAVSVGDRVEAGDVIGMVGDTALGEIGQSSHLHFAVTVDGAGVDPLAYLPS